MKLFGWWKYLLIALVVVVVLMTGWPVYQGYSNTEYSVYYREDRFLDVRIGDKEDYVIGILGEPLDKSWADGLHRYYYSLPRAPGYFYERTLVFSEANVVGKTNQLSIND